MKYILNLAYDGSVYHGWQKQENAISVEETIENAFFKLLGKNIEIIGCGRTDTGVHAKYYIAHFEYNLEIDKEIVYKLNSILPNDIAIYKCYKTNGNFHARFDAISREYKYYIHFKKEPFLFNRSYYMNKELNIELMNDACKILLLNNDFISFCKKGADNKTTICELMLAKWEIENNQIVFTIKADRFLRNMVRSIVGYMINIGLDKITLNKFIEIIEQKKSNQTGFSAPACGLYLTNVTYDFNNL